MKRRAALVDYCSRAAHGFKGAGPILQPARGGRKRGLWVGGLFGVGIAVAGLITLVACGLKAPPKPREIVVPAPVEDVAVRAVPEGLEIKFTLPSESLDGSPLELIGGYRILREGPEGKDMREEVRFSVSEMTQMIGKPVTTLDAPPGLAGTYRYCVVPLDMYGSRPSKRRAGAFCWEGSLSGQGPGSGEQGRED